MYSINIATNRKDDIDPDKTILMNQDAIEAMSKEEIIVDLANGLATHTSDMVADAVKDAVEEAKSASKTEYKDIAQKIVDYIRGYEGHLESSDVAELITADFDL
mgnify:CR=1 FL=1